MFVESTDWKKHGSTGNVQTLRRWQLQTPSIGVGRSLGIYYRGCVVREGECRGRGSGVVIVGTGVDYRVLSDHSIES